ncbi:MAG TPA: DUF2604 domain-containing protein [Allosphingosinicella sp.]|jgi:hypothetical protein|nr:DUF2604 domain-containing protein [Allosphingosinicella sp.]
MTAEKTGKDKDNNSGGNGAGGNSGGGNGGGGNGNGGGNDKVDLIVLVSGSEVEIKAKLNDTLGEVAEKALKKSENVGQPLENWDMRNEDGEVLDLGRPVGSFGFAEGALLSLTLKAGIAG